MPRVHRRRTDRRQIDSAYVGSPHARDLLIGRGRLDERRPQRFSSRDQAAGGRQEPIARIDDRRETALIRRQDAVDFGDDEVRLLRELNVRGETLNELHPSVQAMLRRDAPAERDRIVGLDCVHLPSAQAGGEQREDAGARPDVDHD